MGQITERSLNSHRIKDLGWHSCTDRSGISN